MRWGVRDLTPEPQCSFKCRPPCSCRASGKCLHFLTSEAGMAQHPCTGLLVRWRVTARVTRAGRRTESGAGRSGRPSARQRGHGIERPRWRERGGRDRKLAGRRSYPATPASEEEGATSTTTPSPRRGGHGPRPHPSIPFRVVDGHGLSFSSPDSPGPEAGRRCRPLSRKCEGKLGSLNVKLLEPQPTPPQVPLELGAPCSSAGRRSASPPRGADVWKWPGDTFDCQSLSGPGAG